MGGAGGHLHGCPSQPFHSYYNPLRRTRDSVFLTGNGPKVRS
jgi:hypothetical protein